MWQLHLTESLIGETPTASFLQSWTPAEIAAASSSLGFVFIVCFIFFLRWLGDPKALIEGWKEGRSLRQARRASRTAGSLPVMGAESSIPGAPRPLPKPREEMTDADWVQYGRDAQVAEEAQKGSLEAEARRRERVIELLEKIDKRVHNTNTVHEIRGIVQGMSSSMENLEARLERTAESLQQMEVMNREVLSALPKAMTELTMAAVKLAAAQRTKS